jgi:hypothetical protein
MSMPNQGVKDEDVLQIDIVNGERQESDRDGCDRRDGKLAMPTLRKGTQRRIVTDGVGAFRLGGSRDGGVFGADVILGGKLLLHHLQRFPNRPRGRMKTTTR